MTKPFLRPLVLVMLHLSHIPHIPDTKDPAASVHVDPMPSDWFSKDGRGTIFLEGIPGVGYVVAAAQAMEGNTVSSRHSAILPIDLLTPGSD